MKTMSTVVLSLFVGLTACAPSGGSVAPPAAGAESGPASDAAPASDIIDTAQAAGSFKTLLAAIDAAGLQETLRGDGPFTVFAPTDEAFAKLPPGTVDDLLKPENKEKLRAVLTYHVVAGRVMAADVVKMTAAKTVQGSDLTIAASDAGVKVDGASVTKTDIAANNGVIHVIDTVVLPK
jgi:uncharacterized surface protein with fasciclin (FAS1) repeats